ncbi:hypothetical protein SCP_0500580 [Sparassis crispa]|uniref:Uncharacterized protein n=1 Tax=Sparassis crispa TaxID=139825 RepID=A0A401GLG7_9APHY|nr:hypothetical protein SCP_0500580 [Sparassis crispa]GBE83015.1 hypothetical protein SCP_0500580 [Sparassis crispa]
MSCPVIRATNVDKHPGQLDLRVKRRTQAEVKEAKRAEEKAKEETQLAKVKKLKKIADLEDRLANDTAKIETGCITQSSQQPDGHHDADNRLQQIEQAEQEAIGDASDAEGSELTDIEMENERPKKKPKKQSTRKAIDAAHKQNAKETNK